MRLAYPALLAGLFSCAAAGVPAQDFGPPPTGPGAPLLGQKARAAVSPMFDPASRTGRAGAGAGRVLNQPEAAMFYRKAQAYETGEGVPQDLAKAAELYLRASQMGHPEAMLALGQMHQSGRLAGKDDAAAAWYLRAAQAGSVVGQYNLALLLADGSGVPKDIDSAMAWYERAARSGFGKAQFNLALLLEQRRSTPADLERAYAWFKLAGANGIEVAPGRLAALAPAMSPEQVARADRQAEEWRGAAQAN
jgi:TPR repeat protein